MLKFTPTFPSGQAVRPLSRIWTGCIRTKQRQVLGPSSTKQGRSGSDVPLFGFRGVVPRLTALLYQVKGDYRHRDQ